MVATKYYVDGPGNYLGAYSDGNPSIPGGAVEVGTPPDHAGQIWSGAAWGNIPAIPKITNLAEAEAKNKNIHNINYKTELINSLYAKRTFSFGALTQVEWYSDLALTDKVLNVDVAYNYNALGFATDRTVTRTWYDDDDNAIPETKVSNKDYTINPQDQLDEAILRRQNILRQTNVWLIGGVPPLANADPAVPDTNELEVKQDGIDFFDVYESEASKFKLSGSTSLEFVIRDLDVTQAPGNQWDWLDADATALAITGVADVRDYIIYQLSSGVRNKNGDIV